MSDVILKILSIIGILLLAVLILAVLLLLLVLFFPITYRVSGEKQDALQIKARAIWLFGFIRVKYRYPENGHLLVKLLWFTLFDKQIPADKSETDTSKESDSPSAHLKKESPEVKDAVAKTPETSEKEPPKAATNAEDASRETDSQENHSINQIGENATQELSEDISKNWFVKKIEKIKYTILSICDKIKNIWENISYYVNLLREENTKELFSHIGLRLGKIVKSIRPRHIKADIVFGTGEPDTTGYAYALYGMFSASLGPKVIVVPDFEQAIFKGEFSFSGHITVWILLINALKVFFDKKLHLFMDKVKAAKPSASKASSKA